MNVNGFSTFAQGCYMKPSYIFFNSTTAALCIFCSFKNFSVQKSAGLPLEIFTLFKNFNMHGHHKIHPLPPALSPHSLLTAWPASGYSKQTSGTVRGLSRISLLVTCLRVMWQPAHGTDFQPPSGFFWVSPLHRPIISDMIPFTCMSLLSLSPIVGISCLREPSFRKVSKSGGMSLPFASLSTSIRIRSTCPTVFIKGHSSCVFVRRLGVLHTLYQRLS